MKPSDLQQRFRCVIEGRTFCWSAWGAEEGCGVKLEQGFT